MADVTDLSAVARIEQTSFDDPWPLAALLEELEPSPLRLPLVVEEDDQVVGYLMAWRTADELHILNVAIAPAYRRRGLGAVLLRGALDEALRGGMSQVTLEVRRSNLPALAMYRAFGFADEGVRPNYYADTGEDALVLTLSLTNDGP